MLVETNESRVTGARILGNLEAPARELYAILPTHYKNITNAINSLFDDSELRTLCFELNIEYENLTGSQKEEKIVALVNTFIADSAVHRLTNYIQTKRPHADINTTGYYPDLVLPETFTRPDHGFTREFQERFSSVFSLGELRFLAFQFHIDWDRLPGEGKTDKAISLLSEIVSTQKTQDLLDFLKQERSHVNWDNLYK